MGLTDRQIQNLKPLNKLYKVSDFDGLYLAVSPSGSKSWRFDYRFRGKRKTLTLGPYPVVGLRDARTKLINAKSNLNNSQDPGDLKALSKVVLRKDHENAFETLAMEWLENNRTKWVKGHQRTIISRLQRDIFPFLGGTPISSITPLQLLEVVKKIENRGAIESAHRTLQICKQVFNYALILGKVQSNPALSLKGALRPVEVKHFAALSTPGEFKELLLAIDSYKGSPIVRLALQFAPLVFVRPKELRTAEWSEINMAEKIWSIPGGKMKMGEPHIVPLSTTALRILTELKSYSGSSRFLFPHPTDPNKPMSENAILYALRRMGFTDEQMTGHGFRAIARTLLDEQLNIRVDYIEHQLAHTVKAFNGRAYNRTTHLSGRREMMEKWDAYIGELKSAKR